MNNVSSLKGNMKPNPDSILPTPKITLYSAEHVELGWRGTHYVGAGMINAGNTCYLNSTLQVCLRNWKFNLHRRRWEDNIKTELQEVGCGSVD